MVQERKSPGSRHRHSVGSARSLDSLLDASRFFVRTAEFAMVPAEFSAELSRALAALTELGQRDLMGICVHASGCAVLALLLRATSNPEVSEERASAANRLVETILTGEEVADAVFGLAGERSGSHFLEAALECCHFSLFERAVAGAVLGRLDEYVRDDTGNFAVQSVLKRLAAVLQHEANGRAATLANQMLCELVDPESIGSKTAELLRCRGGVLVWALACDKYTQRKGVLADSILRQWSAEEGDLTTTLTRQILADERSGNEDKVPGSRGPALFARIVNQLLLSDASHRVVHALSLLSRDALLQLSTSGQMSRLILDPLFDGKTCQPSLPKDMGRLLHAIISISADLAKHFAGQHIIRKVYDFAPNAEKELLASQLAQDYDRLIKSKEGRNSLQHMKVEIYRRDPKEWKAQLVKAVRAAELMRDLESTSAANNDKEPAETIDEGFKESRKRKRKHRRQGKSNDE